MNFSNNQQSRTNSCPKDNSLPTSKLTIQLDPNAPQEVSLPDLNIVTSQLQPSIVECNENSIRTRIQQQNQQPHQMPNSIVDGLSNFNHQLLMQSSMGPSQTTQNRLGGIASQDVVGKPQQSSLPMLSQSEVQGLSQTHQLMNIQQLKNKISFQAMKTKIEELENTISLGQENTNSQSYLLNPHDALKSLTTQDLNMLMKELDAESLSKLRNKYKNKEMPQEMVSNHNAPHLIQKHQNDMSPVQQHTSQQQKDSLEKLNQIMNSAYIQEAKNQIAVAQNSCHIDDLGNQVQNQSENCGNVSKSIKPQILVFNNQKQTNIQMPNEAHIIQNPNLDIKQNTNNFQNLNAKQIQHQIDQLTQPFQGQVMHDGTPQNETMNDHSKHEKQANIHKQLKTKSSFTQGSKIESNASNLDSNQNNDKSSRFSMSTKLQLQQGIISKYKKMPSRKGKYNEPYHEGLYRFQDQMAHKNKDEKNKRQKIKDTSKMIKKTEKFNQDLEEQSDEDTYYLLGQNGQKHHISENKLADIKQCDMDDSMMEGENDSQISSDNGLKQNFQNPDGSWSQMGRWTREEHKKFILSLKLFGKDWQKVQEFIVTRSSAQIRSHAQKFFNQVKKKGGNVVIKNHKAMQRKRRKYTQNEEEDTSRNNGSNQYQQVQKVENQANKRIAKLTDRGSNSFSEGHKEINESISYVKYERSLNIKSGRSFYQSQIHASPQEFYLNSNEEIPSSDKKIGFKIVKYDKEMREKHPNLYEMAKQSICFDEFLQPKESYLERVRQWNELNVSIGDSPVFTLYMSKKESIPQQFKHRFKELNQSQHKPQFLDNKFEQSINSLNIQMPLNVSTNGEVDITIKNTKQDIDNPHEDSKRREDGVIKISLNDTPNRENILAKSTIQDKNIVDIQPNDSIVPAQINSNAANYNNNAISLQLHNYTNNLNPNPNHNPSMQSNENSKKTENQKVNKECIEKVKLPSKKISKHKSKKQLKGMTGQNLQKIGSSGSDVQQDKNQNDHQQMIKTNEHIINENTNSLLKQQQTEQNVTHLNSIKNMPQLNNKVDSSSADELSNKQKFAQTVLNFRKFQILQDLRNTKTLGAYNFWGNLSQIGTKVNFISQQKASENSEEHHGEFLKMFQNLIEKDSTTFQRSLLENTEPRNLITAREFKTDMIDFVNSVNTKFIALLKDVQQINTDITKSINTARGAQIISKQVQVIQLEEIQQKVNVLQLELLLYTDFCKRYIYSFESITIPDSIPQMSQMRNQSSSQALLERALNNSDIQNSIGNKYTNTFQTIQSQSIALSQLASKASSMKDMAKDNKMNYQHIRNTNVVRPQAQPQHLLQNSGFQNIQSNNAFQQNSALMPQSALTQLAQNTNNNLLSQPHHNVTNRNQPLISQAANFNIGSNVSQLEALSNSKLAQLLTQQSSLSRPQPHPPQRQDPSLNLAQLQNLLLNQTLLRTLGDKIEKNDQNQ